MLSLLVFVACSTSSDEPAALAPGLAALDMDVTSAYELAVVKTDGSTLIVKGDGTTRPLDLPGEGAQRIAADPESGYLVATDAEVRHHRLGPVTKHEVAAADVVAGCEGAFAATVDGVVKLDAGKPPTPFGTSLPGIRGLTRIDCDTVVAWTADEVHLVEPEAVARVLKTDAVHAVTVKDGALWVAHSSPPVLSREEKGQLVGATPLPADVRAIVWGNGYGLRTDWVYVLASDGISAVEP